MSAQHRMRFQGVGGLVERESKGSWCLSSMLAISLVNLVDESCVGLTKRWGVDLDRAVLTDRDKAGD